MRESVRNLLLNHLKSIESVLTVMNGQPVFGADEFAGLVEPLPAIRPTWSPVNRFGGYQTGHV